MGFNKKFFTTGGIVASSPSAPAALDPFQNFETVTYTGNGGTQKITGYIRKGAAFNGSSSKIDVGSPIPNTDTDVTISTWVNLSSGISSNMHITGTGITSSGSEAPFRATLQYQSANTFRIFSLRQVAGTYYLSPNSSLTNVTINPNTWYHIVWSYTASGRLLNTFLNGTQIDTNVAMTTNGSSVNDSTTVIGSFRSTSGPFFKGKLDQFRIFNTALNSTQAGQLSDEEYGDAKNSVTDFFGDGSGVALYELDEDANDTGAYGSGVIDSGQSAVFSGSSKIIARDIFTSTPSTVSASVWIKATDYTPLSNINVLDLGDPDTSTAQNRIFITSTGDIYVTINGGDGGFAIKNISNFTNNTWHHIGATWDATGGGVTNGIKLYIDGRLASQGDSTTSFLSLTDLAIGVNEDAFDRHFFQGNIDQVRIYSSILSASDMTNLASETNIPTANLVAHYKLDGDATDETTNYDGTWGGTEAYSNPAEFPVYNGTPTNVNFLGMAFQPDLVWIKLRDTVSNHDLIDSVRGATKVIESDNTLAEFTEATNLTSFDSNGFTVGSTARVNKNNEPIVAWCWRAAGAANTYNVLEGGTVTSDSTASGAGITAGTITTGWEVSANRDAGFSIVKFTSSSTISDTIGHGLSSAPEMIIYKRTSQSSNWTVYTNVIDGSWDYLRLNLPNAKGDGSGTFATSSTIKNVSTSENWIAYCFHSVDGYQRISSYDGTNATHRIYTTDDGTPTGNGGFRPRFVMVKCTSDSGTNWWMFDSVRGTTDLDYALVPNSSVDEYTSSGYKLGDTNEDGFTITPNVTDGAWNASGRTYIYLAIA